MTIACPWQGDAHDRAPADGTHPVHMPHRPPPIADPVSLTSLPYRPPRPREAGIHYTTVVLGLGRPRGILTKGRRPELKRISGQEKLPVLALPDGTTVNGSSAIATWARRQQGLSSV